MSESLEDQWQRKKQTKEQARAAKRAKLDPDNSKSAKDVMDERAAEAKKRKREEGDEPEMSEIVPEMPISGLIKEKQEAKRQKRDDRGGTISLEGREKLEKYSDQGTTSASIKAEKKAEKRRAKKEHKLQEKQKKVARLERKKARKEAAKHPATNDTKDKSVKAHESGSDDEDPFGPELDRVDVTGLSDNEAKTSALTATPSPAPESPMFDGPVGQSGSSSVSSIIPPPAVEFSNQTQKPPEELPKPKADPEELRARLQRRLEELKSARNADGLNGKPARTRQELIEARRRKAEQSKAHRKELRRKEKEKEVAQKAEALKLSRGSPLLSPASGSIVSPSEPSNNFSFGRIAFADGQQADARLSSLIHPKKGKGPQDPFTALKAAQSKESRLNNLDEIKKADVAEKDMWLNARKRAHGERIRDDTSLLKKTLKRKEKQKEKSEKEWKERTDGVQKGQAIRQKRREENLRKRKEEKGKKRGTGGGVKKPKQKARPGFEGSFRTKAPRK
ncbi:MAG: hypothetical protein Q9190_002946 [Brigantiaea leucoxantha]